MSGVTRKFKSRRLHKDKNNVISGFIRSLVLNILIFIHASATSGLEWCTTVMPYVERKPVVAFFGLRSTTCGKSSACWLGLQRAPSCSLYVQYVQYSVKRGLQRRLRMPQIFGLCKGVYNVLDSVARALKFNPLVTKRGRRWPLRVFYNFFCGDWISHILTGQLPRSITPATVSLWEMRCSLALSIQM